MQSYVLGNAHFCNETIPDWPFAFKNQREFAGVPTLAPFPSPLVVPSLRKYAHELHRSCAYMHTRVHIHVYIYIYYRYNSLTEIYTRTRGR
ncbi:hypothetical protein PUN28_001054 [Cardiocondyla obscurior]|uniref:Uncharacterized protein n=1 Tax=Cardiocondyla obscurior TaxID=286306 RepID=A0AAW2H396_9HYME